MDEVRNATARFHPLISSCCRTHPALSAGRSAPMDTVMRWEEDLGVLLPPEDHLRATHILANVPGS